MSDFIDHFKACTEKGVKDLPEMAPEGPFVLRVAVRKNHYDRQIYDFLGCVLISGDGEHYGTVTPFSQLAPQTLEFMHARLVELGGSPPPLPEAYTVEAQRKSAILQKPLAK